MSRATSRRRCGGSLKEGRYGMGKVRLGGGSQRKWSLLSVVISAACFGTSAILAPLAYKSGAHPLPLLAWRFAIAAILLALVVAVRDRRALVVPAAEIGRFALLALTGYGVSSICFFFALMHADAAVVAVLLYAYPALVAIGGWVFFREAISWQRVLAIVMTLLGCVLVVGLIGPGVRVVSWEGIALGAGAAVGYATYTLLSHRWLHGRSRLVVMTYVFAIATLLPVVLVVATEGVSGLSAASWTSETWRLLGMIIAVPTFAAVLLYMGGIRSLGPSQAALVSGFEPVFSIVLARVFLPGQSALSPLQLAGTALVLFGVAVSEVKGSWTEGPPAA